MSDERTHYVYEAYDADGLSLYVGCTGNPANRYRAHMTGNGDARGWFQDFVTHWRVSGPYPKVVAFRLEKERIDRAQPIWNGHSTENLLHNRRLIAKYLAYHGFRFVENPFRLTRPDLVPVGPSKRRRGPSKRRGRRKLALVEGGAA